MIHSLATLILLASSVQHAYIALKCWQSRQAIGMRAFSLTTAMLALWAFIYYLEWMASDWMSKTALLHGRIVAAYATSFFVIFCFEYIGQARVFHRPWVAWANWANPIFWTVAFALNPWTEWVFSWSNTDAALGTSSVVYQTPYYVFRASIIGHSLVGGIPLLRTYARSGSSFRSQTLVLVLALALIWGVELADWLVQPLIDPVPFLLAFTGAFYVYQLQRGGVLGIIPLRRETLLENLQLGLIVFDAYRRVVEINSEASHLLRVSRLDLQGRHWGEKLETLFENERLTWGDREERRELRIHERWLEVRLKPLHADGGSRIGWLMTLRDTTEQQTSLELIRQNEQRLKVHLQLTPLAYLELDPELRVRDCNESAARAFGWPADQLIGQSAIEALFSKNDRPVARELFGQVLAQELNINCAFVNQRAEGQRVVCDWYNTPLLDEKGQTVGVASLVLDVTESCLAIAEMLSKTTELQTILRALPDLYFRIDYEGTYLECKATETDELLMPTQQILGTKLADNLPPDIAHRSLEAVRKACNFNVNQTFEYELEVKGQTHYYEARISPLNRNECVALVRNISDLKQAQLELITKNEVLDAYSQHLKRIQHISSSSFSKYRHKFAPLFQDFLETGCDIFGMEHGLVSRVQNDTYWIFSAHSSLDFDIGHRFELRDTLCRRVIRTEQPLYLSYPYSRQHLGREDVFAYLSAPIFVGGRIFGTLSFFSTEPYSRDIQSYHFEILELLADLIGKYIALQREEQSRQAAEKELLNSQKRYQGLVEAQSDLILRFSPKLRITFANRAFFECFGLDRATGPYSEPFRRQEQLLAGLIEQQYKHLHAPPHRVEFEQILETPRGDRWFSYEIIALVDELGEASEYQLVLRDLTDRRQAQERIAFQANLLDQVSSAVIALDLKGRINYWNRSAEQLLGWPAEAVLHRPIDSPELPPSFAQLFGRAVGRIQRDFSYEGEALLENRSGQEVPVLASLGLVLGQNQEPVAIVGILVDITERKEAENELLRAKTAAEEATAAKTNFLAVMSHEIRTPLNAVIGLTGLLNQANLTAEQADTIRTIRQSGETLLSLLNNILDFTKIESGKMELSLQPCSLVELVEGVLELMQGQARSQDIRLYALLPDDLPPSLNLDGPKLQQVLLNLVSNAIKFTAEGYVAVSVGWETGEQPTLRFSVRDTGIGIPPERADRLFQVFSQLDSSSKRRYTGTGLGLAICKRLVEMMGGQIGLDAVTGKGAQFSFTLPLPPDTQRPLPDRPWTGQRVWIVDDQPTGRQRWLTQAALLGLEAQAPTRWSMPEGFDQVWINYSCWTEARDRELASQNLPYLVYETPPDERPNDPRWLPTPVRWSAFVAALRRLTQPDSVPAAARPATPTSSIDGSLHDRFPLRILVAEDHPINQKLILLLLQRMGYEPDLAANGREVLEALARQPYDLIFMDIQMPEMDGIEAAQHIIAQEPDPLRRPAIVAMTANAFGSEREHCLRLGFSDYLTKPIRMELVQKAIETIGRQRLAEVG